MPVLEYTKTGAPQTPICPHSKLDSTALDGSALGGSALGGSALGGGTL